jgi:hypothetical protein
MRTAARPARRAALLHEASARGMPAPDSPARENFQSPRKRPG